MNVVLSGPYAVTTCTNSSTPTTTWSALLLASCPNTKHAGLSQYSGYCSMISPFVMQFTTSSRVVYTRCSILDVVRWRRSRSIPRALYPVAASLMSNARTSGWRHHGTFPGYHRCLDCPFNHLVLPKMSALVSMVTRRRAPSSGLLR